MRECVSKLAGEQSASLLPILPLPTATLIQSLCSQPSYKGQHERHYRLHSLCRCRGCSACPQIAAIQDHVQITIRTAAKLSCEVPELSRGSDTLVVCRWRRQIIAAMLFAAVNAWGGCFQYKIGLAHEPDHPLSDRVIFSFGFTVAVGILSPLVPSCLLALTCTEQSGLSSLLRRLLSMQPLRALADVSYEVYLLHPLVSPPESLQCLVLLQ